MRSAGCFNLILVLRLSTCYIIFVLGLGHGERLLYHLCHHLGPSNVEGHMAKVMATRNVSLDGFADVVDETQLSQELHFYARAPYR